MEFYANIGNTKAWGNSAANLTPTENPFNQFVEMCRVSQEWEEAGGWRVDVASDILATAAALSTLPLVLGRVRWGAAGATHICDFDVGRGQVLFLTGAEISVQVLVQANTRAPQVTARATCIPAEGVPSRVVPLTLTQIIPQILAAGTVQIARPAFATSWSMRRPSYLNAANPAFEVDEIDSNGFTVDGVSFAAFSNNVRGNIGSWYPLSSMATGLQITNNNAGNANNVVFTWGLCL